MRSHQIRLHIKTTSITSKVFFKNQRQPIVQASPSIHQSSPHPPPLIIIHPEERIWAGQTPRREPRVPGAPKIKHDKMKQFYMIDMRRKM